MTAPWYHFDPIFLADAEIAKVVGLSAAEWKAAALVLERSGLSRRDPLFKNQRCWPRVRDFLYRRAGGALPGEDENHGIVEDLDALRSGGKRRSPEPGRVENWGAFRKGRKRSAPKTT